METDIPFICACETWKQQVTSVPVVAGCCNTCSAIVRTCVVYLYCSLYKYVGYTKLILHDTRNLFRNKS